VTVVRPSRTPVRSIDAPRARLAAAALMLSVGVLTCVAASSSPQLVPVRHPQGSLHGFLVLRSLDGSTVADGDVIQSVTGERVTARTVFHFRDGSIDDETAVFSQHGVYRLLSDHHVQRGPTFEQPLSMDFDVARGHVVVHTKGDGGEDKVDDEQMPLPADVANGLLTTLLGDVVATELPLTVSFVAATPAPRLVKLVITKVGSAPFSIGDTPKTATDYLVRTDIGGLTGVLAAVFHKQPPDAHVWIMGGDEPVFVKSEAPMYPGGAILRTELASPRWPRWPR
jgi:hypothetical protein